MENKIETIIKKRVNNKNIILNHAIITLRTLVPRSKLIKKYEKKQHNFISKLHKKHRVNKSFADAYLHKK